MINFGSLYSNVTSISYGNISATKAYLGYQQVWPVTKAGSNILEYTSLIDIGQYYHWIYNKNGYYYWSTAEEAESDVSTDPSWYYQEPFDVSIDRTAIDSSITSEPNPCAGRVLSGPGTVPDYLYAGTVTLVNTAHSILGNNSIERGYLPDYITRLTLPSELTTIGDYALSNMEYLEYVDIPESVTTIGAHAFAFSGGYGAGIQQESWRNGLTVHIPYNTTIIPEGCFEYGVINKNTLSLPDSITDISANAFYNTIVVTDSSILTVTMPANLQRIGNIAFSLSLADPSHWGAEYDYYDFIYDFSNCTQIPTVATSSLACMEQVDPYTGDVVWPTQTVIKVPSSLYNDWITTGNWPYYSKYIIPA